LTTTISVLLPVLAQAFGFSYAEVGLFKGLKSTSQAVLEMCSGWLSEKLGECRLIAIGLASAGAGYGLLSMAPGALLLAASLLIIGAGTALHHAPSSALIVASYPNVGRSSALGIYNASGDAGKLVFSGGVSLAIGAGFAWHQISLLYGLIALLTAIVIAIVARSCLQNPGADTQPESDGPDGLAIAGWGILNWRSFGALLVVTSIDTMVQTGVLVFAAFLMLSKGLSLPVATAATVALLAGGMFGKAACGFLADHIGARPAFTLIQVLTALGLFLVVIAPDWLALAMLLPLGAVLQGSSSVTYGYAADLIHPRRMARGYALLYSSGTFAAAAGPLAIGLVADAFGIEAAMVALAVLTTLAVPPIFILPASNRV